ncbi:site-specific integrase [Streptomyces bobili]|uniref:site-specific integrase n=1 Tax=Streptomyces bobili TaxID=67280 RepID=UPI001FC9A392|nr:site-specific integrase [Streptomyces bobili]
MLVDRYRIRCQPVRDLIVDYLRERQPSLDFASLDAISRTLAGLFWARIEALAPGIDTLRLPPAVARAWKDDLKVKKRTVVGPDGKSVEVSSPRLNAKDELMRVRAFYLDIAQWAAEEPARWGPWAVPCPISDDEIHKAKERKRRKARMDQRTRERLPVLPILVSTSDRRRREAAELLQAAGDTEPGALIPGTGGAMRRAIAPKAAGHLIWAEETSSGRRRNLSYEEEEAFWAFAAIEVLRLTGVRNEELLELTHQSVTQYRLPSTDEVVPLLQIAPSKTDTERLLLVSPELADVLSAITSRLRGPRGAVPLVAAYDVREKVWNPPMPLLFQRGIGSEHRAFTPTAIRKLLINALAATGLTNADGEALSFSPHDFRRIFVTDAIMNGLPPHIAQVICGHKSIDTTIDTRRSTLPRRSRPTGRSSPADGPPAPARSTGSRQRRNGTPSSPTSRSGKCPSAPAHAPSDPPASMSTLVSDARSSGRTRPNAGGWSIFATTSSRASPRPNAKGGSARSRVSRSAWLAPRRSSASSIGATGSIRPWTLASPPCVVIDEPTKVGCRMALNQDGEQV